MAIKTNIIVNPILSEKSHSLTEQFNKYVFKVDKRANKLEIKKAIEKRFNVKIVNVTTMNYKGKKKIAKQIQNEINNLNPEKKQDLASINSRLDKPVVGGVTFRGDDEGELKDISLTNSCLGASGIAFKKIILNHQ